MPAPIRFSPAPHQRRWFDALSYPVVLAGNLLVAALAYPGFSTARVRWSPDLETLLDLVRERTRPVIFYSWHAYELSLLCSIYHLPPDIRPVGIGHDGILSRIFQMATAWLGIPVWVYRRRSPVRPGQQIIDLVRSAPEPPVLGLVPDAGGPYGEMKPGILTVARATGAHLIPVAVQAEPVARLRRPAPYLLPLPFAEVLVHYGAPLDGSTVSLEEAQAALAEQDAKAERIHWTRPAPRRL